MILRGVPLELHGQVAAHVDALQREFEMVLRDQADAGRAATDPVPTDLRGRFQQLRHEFGYLGEQTHAVLTDARERGGAVADIAFDASPDVAEVSRGLLSLLVDADEYCRAGDLMTLAAPPEVLAFHEWFLTELISQSEGNPPRPWRGSSPDLPGDADGDDNDDVDDDPTAGWEMASEGSTVRISFTGDLDLKSAPHLRTLVSDATQDPGLAVLELDLSGVTFLDSVGLSVLLTVRMRLVNDVVSVTVVPSPAVERVFELAGVSDLFA